MRYFGDHDAVPSGASKAGLPRTPAVAAVSSVADGVGGRILPTGLLPLIGALATAIGAPLLIMWIMSPDDPLPSFVNTSLGIFLAIQMGHYALKRISDFPTIEAMGSVLAVFSGSFLLVVSVLLVARIDHHQFSFVVGYIATIIWFAVVLWLARNGRPRQFALVPVGDALTVRGLTGAKWSVAGLDDGPPVSCDGVVVDLGAELGPKWREFLTRCALAGVPVYHFKQVREALTGRLEIERLSENVLGGPDAHEVYRTIKRWIDFAGALVALVVLGPLLIAIAALIRLDSQGPALFRQTRLTRGGRAFTIYKFRTMRVDAARPGSRHDAVTHERDPRITRVGAVLRKTRIDELPQILNILKGEMSWIGPRPEALPLAEWYRKQLPFYEYRYTVWPGITGWAQVNQGHVTEPNDVLAKLYYDFYYIKNFSVWLDILIVLKTVRTIMTGFGAR